ncbi:Nucleic acid-binding protein [Corchorus capsularis]|uniref:Nucleic acid-binding protein n=1 Tax=Corchorus capsularis TaxID=210143 RepID=A0A1R3HF91_COCAP|nr:Nucleic acid-binding protein [Corchorus capsularis]
MSLKEISQLAPPGQNQIIKLRIARIWECTIPTTQKNIGIAFLGTDIKRDGVHVQITQRDAAKFRTMLNEGMLYQITRFQVVIPFMRNLCVSRKYAILFNKNTVVKPIPEDPTPYPRFYFEFASLERMNELANSDKYLIDTYGILLSITTAEEIHIAKHNKDAGKKEVVIKKIDGNEMKLTIWQGCFDQMDDDFLLSMRPPPVMVFAAVVVRTFEDIPEVSLIRNRYEGFEEKAQLIKADNPFTQIPSSSKEIPVATLAELLTFEPQVIKEISQEKVPETVLAIRDKKFEFKIGLTKRAVEENSPTYKIYAARLIYAVQATDNIEKGKLPLVEDSVPGKLVVQQDSGLEENDDETYNGPSSPTDSQVEKDLFQEVSTFKKMKKGEEETEEETKERKED